MNEEWRARFLPRFLESTRRRLARAQALVEGGDAEALARELHALLGEAKMLDLHSIADDVGRGELAARAWAEGDEGPRAACVTCLDAIGRSVAALAFAPLGDAAGERA